MQNKLLAWLDSDPTRAEERLKDIRRRLIYWFGKKGCLTEQDTEDNTGETISRVAKILEEKNEIPDVVPEKFIFGVANNVFKEYWKRIERERNSFELSADPESRQKSNPEETREDILDDLETEDRLKCLDKCMKKLDSEEQELVRLYSQSEKHYSRQIVKKFKGSRNAIRIRIFRILNFKLGPCVKECLNYS